MANELSWVMPTLLCFCMGLSGCASLTMERQQAFAVQTHHGDVERAGVDCDLRNDAGTWSLTSPASVEVHKSAENLVVECKEEHLSGKASVKSAVNAAYASNFLFLFGIGYLIDKYTGAGFDYPETVVVQLSADRKAETARNDEASSGVVPD